MSELEAFAQEQLNRPPGQIEPMPQFVSYEPFTYSAAGMRAPFQAPVDIASAIQQQNNNDIRPDEDRPREYLESFSLNDLSMVGILSRGDTIWALVEDQNNEVHRVMVGNYLGRNHGRVVATTPTRIDLIEIVPSGSGGWIERPQTITLEEAGSQ